MNKPREQPKPADAVRSEGLLPVDEPDSNLEIAEEVAFVLQSEQTRDIGATPPDGPGANPAEAMAKAPGAPAPPDDDDKLAKP